jgi:outer membrane protein OmpA-like peptidoglycan-associated protein
MRKDTPMRDERKSLRPAVLFFLLLSSIVAVPLVAESQVRGFHARLTPYAGVPIWADDVNQQMKALFGGRAALMLNQYVGIEGVYGFSPGETDSGPWPFHPTIPPTQQPPNPSDPVEDDIHHYGLDLVVNFGAHKVTPYIFGGWQHVQFKNNDPNWGTTTFHGYELGAGLNWYVAPRIAIRLEARDVAFEFDNPPGEAPDGTNHNIFVTGGLQFSFFGHVGVADADSDGVGDKKDTCPGTPRGALVDVKGCPIDGDADGVPDGIDQCPNTPVGATVDAKGCPSDDDADGVFNGVDKCPQTPVGAMVDATGCPLDSDKDGVADGIDKCANTPVLAKVDSTGCPLDSDADGIFDGLDLCPNTPPQAKVDRDGCPIEISEKEVELLDTGKITVRNINFQTSKWDILPESKPVLDEIGKILIQWPQLRVEIGGHADSRGAEKFNLDLSEKRAQSVLDYLVKNFPQINPTQFSAKGYGESQPVASNKTADGMAKNRRVEFKVLNTEALIKERERRRLLEKDE